MPCELVGEAEGPARGARHDPARAAPCLLVPGEFAEDHGLPAARAAPPAIRAHLLEVPLSVGRQQEPRAKGAGEQPARRADVLHDLIARQKLRALRAPVLVGGGKEEKYILTLFLG